MKKKMVWLVLALLLLLALALLAYRFLTDAQNYTAPEIPSEASDFSPPALDFTFYDLEGNDVRLSDFSGKPVVLHFWASWCAPCREELPSFQRFYDAYGQEVVFLMVNLTDGALETETDAKTFLQEQAFTFPAYLDLDLEGMHAYRVYSLPTTILLDKNQVIVHRENSVMSPQKLESLLQTLR